MQVGGRIEPLDQQEREWLRSQAATLRSLAARGSIDPSGPRGDLTPAQLDELWLAVAAAAPGNELADQLVNAFGLAFGQWLADELALEWVVHVSDVGSMVAVHGQPGDVLVFPTELVARRLARGEHAFFAPLADQLCAQVAQLRP